MAPFPFAYRYGMDEEAASQWALQELDMVLHTQTDPSETAAMVIEPVLGEGGYIPVPASFLQGLRRVCDEHGILLILDEIQSGMGRTGRMFAHEHANVRADILVVAKGLASGFPISCVASSQEHMSKWTVGAHGGTYGGNPMGCAAAEATLKVIEEEGLLENAAMLGEQLMAGLKAIQAQYPVIGDVRGLGLMVGTEFVALDGALAKKVVEHALESGKLILLTCGMYGNVIRWIPPLVVTEAQIAGALKTFKQAVAASV